MYALVESGQAWLEQLTYQMNKMSYKQQSDLLAGPIGESFPQSCLMKAVVAEHSALPGLLKMRLTRNLHEISDDAVQVSITLCQLYVKFAFADP